VAANEFSARHQEARQILDALNEQAQEAVVLAEAAGQEKAHPFNHPYRRFREKLTDFEGLASLLQQRLRESSQSWSRPDEAPARSKELRIQFDALDHLMLILFARTTVQFVRSLAEEYELPLGSAEGLSYDLTALRANLARLRGSDMKGRSDASLATDLAEAETTLQEIIARIPPMLDFGKEKRGVRSRNRTRKMLGGPRPS
jgi:hypothetical protein